MSRDSTCKLRLFFYEKSESGKALRFVDKPTRADVKRWEWIPVSLILHTTKFPKVAGRDYQEWEITVPEFIAEQKNLGDFEV